MPRGRLGGAARRDGLRAMRFEQLCVETRIKRHALREQQRMDEMRRATPDWVDMDAQLKQLQLDAEMDAMEAAIDARRPVAPILNFDLMPRFKPNGFSPPPPPGGKNWKYTDTTEGRRPEDDWRNYE